MTNNPNIPEPVQITGWVSPDEVVGISVSGSREDYYRYWKPSAYRMVDLQAENDRLKTALASIRDILEQPDHRDVLPEMIYRIAVKALGDSDERY